MHRYALYMFVYWYTTTVDNYMAKALFNVAMLFIRLSLNLNHIYVIYSYVYLNRAKLGVKSMLLSTVRWTEQQVSTYMTYLEQISKAKTEEERMELRLKKEKHLREAQELGELMRIEKEEEEKVRRQEEEEEERAARELDEQAEAECEQQQQQQQLQGAEGMGNDESAMKLKKLLKKKTKNKQPKQPSAIEVCDF